MATLQKLRNMGPLLVIFVGLALFAFIAGDAWKLVQSHTADNNAGSVNGEKLSAMDFQKMYEEYSNVVKFVRGTQNLTEEEANQVKDEIWNTYISNSVIKAEAEKIGLTVTAAELQAVVNDGTNPLLQNTPFRGANGGFDKDILNNFLAEYDNNKDNAQFVEQYKPAYDYWKFIEKSLMQELLIYKYQALVQNSFIGNPIAAKYNYEAGNSTCDIEVVAYPYAALSDADHTATESEVKSLYNKKKEGYLQPYETRNIKHVSHHVTPSAADRAELEAELNEYAEQLKNESEEYSVISRLANSEVSYSELPWLKSAFPEEVQVRLDETETNSVAGPFYNQSDDSYTVFKLISKSTLPEEVQYSMLVINGETAEQTTAITDSLLKVLKNGTPFKEVAKNYQQENGDSLWLKSTDYEGMAVASNTVLSKLIYGKKGGYEVYDVENAPAKIIYRILDTKNPIDKYQAVVIKRTVQFSKETYNAAYNKFSSYVASCKNITDLEKNAEAEGYRVISQNNINTSTHKVANISGTRDAIKWIFSAKIDEVSPLYECGANDYLLVTALSGINEKGYVSLETLRSMLNREIINNKKADKILADIKGKSMDELKNDPNVKTCDVKRITFSAPAYISVTASNEPAISAAVSKMQQGEVSAPIKGNNGIYVVRVVNKTEKGGEYNASAEEEKIKSQGSRESYRFLNELIQKANVEDNRYLYF